MNDRSPVIARSEATKQSRGHSTAVCGPSAPHVPTPLDCFVARAPRNDGAAKCVSDRLRADPILVIARSEATKQSRGRITAVCGPLRRTCRRPWIASSQGLLAMTARPTWLRELQMHGTAMRTLRERSASGRSYSRHCEERSDEAIQGATALPSAAPWRRTCRRPWIASSQGLLAMTARPTWLRDLQMQGTAMRTLRERSASGRSYSRHCEERSDEAIQGPQHHRLRPPGAARAAALDCFVARAPRNDGVANMAGAARASGPGATSSGNSACGLAPR